MRALLFATLAACAEPDLHSPPLEPEEPEEPVYDTGCDLAYRNMPPPDPAVIEEQNKAIPQTCISKLDDPLLGPRCRSLMDKSLAGYFGEGARLEAIRLLGVQP